MMNKINTERTAIAGVTVLKILDDSMRMGIIRTLNRLWDAKDVAGFPGPQPISIERRHLHLLQENEYYVGFKNDGERYALGVVKYDDRYMCVLINRNLEVQLIKARCTKHMYSGTLLDCELIDKTLVVFDCPAHCGTSLKQATFEERMSAIKSSCEALQEQCEFTVQCKEFVNLKTSKEFLQRQAEENTDGIILMPNKAIVQQGTHSTMFKLKPKHKNTVDFFISNKKPQLQNGGKLVNTRTKVNLNDLDCEQKIVECEFVGDNTWSALSIRNDKNMPNSTYTFKKTLVNIEEDIKPEELLVPL